MAAEKLVELPDIGDFPSVEVIEILVSVGESVAEEDSLITLESDKATMEIPSPHAGVVKSIEVSVGDKISQGHPVVRLEVEESAAPDSQSTPSVDDAVAEQQTPEAPPVSEEKSRPQETVAEKPSSPPAQAPAGSGGLAHASPSVRRFARELGVDLTKVTGSGPKNRILKEDVQDFVKQTLNAPPTASSGLALNLGEAPEIDFSRFGEIESQPLGRIKKISGAHLHRSWVTVPHVTQFDEADITSLEAFRKQQKDSAAQQDIKLTFMPFLMKACAAALQAFPQFNSSLSADGEQLILKKYVHIGVAVDTPNGLMVPVIRDVDQKGIFDLAGELMAISQRTRDGKLSPADMQGGCFSISSLGGIGGTQFTPIVNAPEVAILGVSRTQTRPVWNGSEFEPRLMMPFSLSYDHRVIDGAEGVRFTSYLAGLLADIRRLLL